jgi:hypothetical protein
MSSCPEEWRPVVGLEGRYEVSSVGLVRSLDQRRSWPASRRHPAGHTSIAPGRVLALFADRYGYLAFKVDGRNRKVHQEVARAFIGPAPNGEAVLHRNDVKKDNRPANLRYGTQKANGEDGAANRSYASGAAHYATSLTEVDVAAIKGLRDHVSQANLARAFGIAQPTVHDMQVGKTWPYVVPMNADDARRELDRRRAV